MSLLGIIETLRRNLKTVVFGCYVVLALVVIADIARVVTADEHHAASPSEASAKEGPASEHAVAPAGEPAEAHSPAVASAEEGGFWAEAYEISESTPVFWTAFGFLGCVLLVVVSKSYGHFGVSVREDYYSE